jgi:16S rRNA (guanine527-N7)-methyltransferase
VAAQSLKDVETRHFRDSLQLLSFAPKGVRRWIDLGSGGGFPGLVIAIAGPERLPGLTVTLIEADQRKAEFLRTVIRAVDVAATVIATRIEKVEPFEVDVVSARALAPLPKLIALAEPFLTLGTTCLFSKGERYKEELADAIKDWQFTVETHPSHTDPNAAILSLKDIRHA